MTDRCWSASCADEAATARLGEDLAAGAARRATCWRCKGDLGAGKSTLARGSDPGAGRRSRPRRAEPDLHAGAEPTTRALPVASFRPLPAVGSPAELDELGFDEALARRRRAGRMAGAGRRPSAGRRRSSSNSSSMATAGWRDLSGAGAAFDRVGALAGHARFPRRGRLGRARSGAFHRRRLGALL